MIKMFQHVPVLDLLQGSITLVTPVAPDASVETPPVPPVWRRASHWPVTPIAPVLPDTPVTAPRPVLPGKPGKPRQSSGHQLQRPVLPLVCAPKTKMAISGNILQGKLAAASGELAAAHAKAKARAHIMDINKLVIPEHNNGI